MVVVYGLRLPSYYLHALFPQLYVVLRHAFYIAIVSRTDCVDVILCFVSRCCSSVRTTPISLTTRQMTPSMQLVSRCCSSVRTTPISLTTRQMTPSMQLVSRCCSSVRTTPISLTTRQMTPSMQLVSRCCSSVRTKPISLRVFSKITLGSSDSQRRQFGAITIAKLLASIFVTATFSGAANTCAATEHDVITDRRPNTRCDHG